MKRLLLLLVVMGGCCEEPKREVIIKIAPPTAEEVHRHYTAGYNAGARCIGRMWRTPNLTEEAAMAGAIREISNYVWSVTGSSVE